MKPHLHLKYIKEVFEKIENIDDDQREELLIGSITNDLCEFTEEFNRFYMGKGFIDETIGVHSALYQSHFGELSALHSMANKELEPIETTQSHILNWLNFLEMIVIDDTVDKQYLNQKMSSFQDHFGDIVKKFKFRFSDIIDTDDIVDARLRTAGMIVHIIQDSYTVSHAQRDFENGEIEMFHNYGKQNFFEHKKCDDVQEKHKEMMLKRTTEVLSLLLEKKSASHLYPIIFKTSKSAFSSKSVGFDCKECFKS